MAVYAPKPKNSKWQIIAGVCIVLLLVAVGAGIFWFKHTQPEPLDAVTNCPRIDGKIHPTGILTILVDETDPLTELQEETFRIKLNNLISSVPDGTMVSIYAMKAESNDKHGSLINLCKPADGSKASELTENKKLMKQRYVKNFLRPMNKVLSSLLKVEQPSKESLLMEQLQFVANNFDRWQTDGEKQLVIFSDMLQNKNPKSSGKNKKGKATDKAFSMYSQNYPTYKEFSKTMYARQLKLSIPDVQVELYYFINNPQFQNNKNVKFWEEYFAAAGAQVVKVEPIGR